MIQPPQGLPVEETAVDQYPDDAAVTGRKVGFGLADQAPGVAGLMALDFRDDTGDWELGTEVKGHDGLEPETVTSIDWRRPDRSFCVLTRVTQPAP